MSSRKAQLLPTSSGHTLHETVSRAGAPTVSTRQPESLGPVVGTSPLRDSAEDWVLSLPLCHYPVLFCTFGLFDQLPLWWQQTLSFRWVPGTLPSASYTLSYAVPTITIWRRNNYDPRFTTKELELREVTSPSLQKLKGTKLEERRGGSS